jgi:hypothetical protein
MGRTICRDCGRAMEIEEITFDGKHDHCPGPVKKNLQEAIGGALSQQGSAEPSSETGHLRPTELLLSYTEFKSAVAGKVLNATERQWLYQWELWDLACSPMDDNERRFIRYGHYLGFHSRPQPAVPEGWTQRFRALMRDLWEESEDQPCDPMNNDKMREAFEALVKMHPGIYWDGKRYAPDHNKFCHEGGEVSLEAEMNASDMQVRFEGYCLARSQQAESAEPELFNLKCAMVDCTRIVAAVAYPDQRDLGSYKSLARRKLKELETLARNGYTRTGADQGWEYVDTYLTQQAAEARINSGPYGRVMVESAYRNKEMQAVRKFLMSLAAALSIAEKREDDQ